MPAGHLVEMVTGHEHCRTLLGTVSEDSAQLDHPRRIESIGRLIQDQQAG
jgi:hypothetical protein